MFKRSPRNSTSLSKSPPLTPQPNATSLSVPDYVRPSSRLSGAEAATGIALDVLKDILEAIDTLPCIKYIASAGVKILEIIDEVQTNKEDIKNVGFRAKDMVIAVAQACKGAEADIASQLENDLKQLTGTMNDILALARELASRKWHRKILYKTDDAAAVKALDAQLTHAFQIFEIQSNVSLRITQQKLIRSTTLVATPTEVRPTLVKDCPLRVEEGIYMIRNASDGRVLETKHTRLSSTRRNTHVYLAPSRGGASLFQLWIVFSRTGKEFDYAIRNLATGVVLDIFCSREDVGTQVIGHSDYGKAWQTWGFFGSREASSFDYVTIRSYGPPVVLDSRCVTNAAMECDYLHTSCIGPNGAHPSQEWSLTRFPAYTPPLSTSPSHGPQVDVLTRRRFYLQNVASDGYAVVTGLHDNMDDPNVTISQDRTSATPWFFVHTAKSMYMEAYEDMFALVAGDPPLVGSLDFWGQSHIVVSSERFWPSDSHHMWKAIPRDGGFTFKNFATGRLLCQSRITGIVDTAPNTAFEQTRCMWRLVDASTGEVCPVLYDSMLSVLPHQLAGPPPAPTKVQKSVQKLTLRTASASSEETQAFLGELQYEHDLMHDMLETGYTSLIIAPLKILGWRKGRVSQMKALDEESFLGLPTITAATTRFETCEAD